jgi:hypothetical protein
MTHHCRQDRRLVATLTLWLTASLHHQAALLQQQWRTQQQHRVCLAA